MKKGSKSSTPSTKIKIRTRITQHYPTFLMNLIGELKSQSLAQGRMTASFMVEGLPVTVNTMYHHTRFGTRLTKEAKAFREMVAWRMGPLKTTWAPKGPVAFVIVMESSFWITKEHTVRAMDVDNRIKPLIDAIKECSPMPDELCWHFHAFKLASTIERTTVHMFELGDIVDLYVPERT